MRGECGLQSRLVITINDNWRYIHYMDGSEELYNVIKDPHEWDNLAKNSKFDAIKKKLKAEAPKSFAPPATSTRKLQLVTEGENYHWKPKPSKKKKWRSGKRRK